VFEIIFCKLKYLIVVLFFPQTKLTSLHKTEVKPLESHGLLLCCFY